MGILAESESISEKNLRLAKERHAARSASKIELAEAQALYEGAVADYKNSIYDYKIVRLSLLSLCGKDIHEKLVPLKNSLRRRRRSRYRRRILPFFRKKKKAR